MANSHNTMFWGTAPSTTCLKLWEFTEPGKLSDILVFGIGDGRNVIFLAQQGYHVTAVDTSKETVEKAQNWANDLNIQINAFQVDMGSLDLGGSYDAIVSVGFAHIIPKEKRIEVFACLERITKDGGFHAVSAFVDKPFLSKNLITSEKLLTSGDLLSYYHSWRIHWATQELFKNGDCVHCVDRLIAEKIPAGKKVTAEEIQQTLGIV